MCLYFLYKKIKKNIVSTSFLIIWSLSINTFLSIVSYCSSNQAKNFSSDTDCTTIGIELCNIPHISEHWP